MPRELRNPRETSRHVAEHCHFTISFLLLKKVVTKRAMFTECFFSPSFKLCNRKFLSQLTKPKLKSSEKFDVVKIFSLTNKIPNHILLDLGSN